MPIILSQLNYDPALKANGADQFSTGFVSRAADPFEEALSARIFVRLNDGVDNAPSTLVDFDSGGHIVLTAGRIVRKREREYGIVQGQAWQVKVRNKDKALLNYDLANCWCCIEGGFESADEWAVFAQGKIDSVNFSTDGTCTIEVHDAIIDLLNYKLQRDYYFDTVGHVSDMTTVKMSGDGRGFDNDVGLTLGSPHLAVDAEYQINFFSPTGYTITVSEVEYGPFSILSDGLAGPGNITIPAAAWTEGGPFTAGDEFVFWTTAAREPYLLTPIFMIMELIRNIADVSVYDVKAGSYYSQAYRDTATWYQAAYQVSESIDGGTDNTFALRGERKRGTPIMDMIQDALKLVNASIYTTYTGQLGVWLLRPTEGATVLLNGDPEAGVVDIIGTSVRDTLEYAANDVSFEYLSLSGEDAVYTATDDDPSISETRSVVLASGWRVRGEVVQSAANIYLNRFKDARRQYIIDTTLAGVLADVTLGVSVNEPDVGLTVTTSDVTEMSINLLGQTATISTHTDPVAMERYAIVGDATTDPVGSTVGSLDRVW